MFLHPKFQVRSIYRDIIARNFGSALETVDFSKPEEARVHINTWISNQTNNLIRDMLLEGSITNDTPSVLVNTIYFDAFWVIEFKILDEPGEFFVNKTHKVNATMMEARTRGGYLNSSLLRAELVELPFRSSNVSMVFVLPHAVDGLSGVEDKLDRFDWRDYENVKNYLGLKVEMPKFKTEISMELNNQLKEVISDGNNQLKII
jgi:serpin B